MICGQGRVPAEPGACPDLLIAAESGHCNQILANFARKFLLDETG